MNHGDFAAKQSGLMPRYEGLTQAAPRYEELEQAVPKESIAQLTLILASNVVEQAFNVLEKVEHKLSSVAIAEPPVDLGPTPMRDDDREWPHLFTS